MENMEYKVVYDHKGFIIEAGSNGWIPDRETATKVLNHQQERALFKDTKLYLIERDALKICRPCRRFKDKEVLNWDYFFVDALSPGDYVEEEIVSEFMDALMPASMRCDCAQLGEAHSIRLDENGKERNTYLTFKRVGEDVYEYCGDCFRGMNKMTGTVPSYI